MNDYIADIESVFDQFNIDAYVSGYTEGPSVVRYEVTLGKGVRVERIAQLQGNIAYATAAESVRVLAPIPGKTAVGIELPKEDREVVKFDEMPPCDDPLEFSAGRGVGGEVVKVNLAKMPHLLVAGTTGSGKSSFINSMLVSLLQTDPEDLGLVLIDPKMIELTPYDGVPHLMRPVVTETDEAIDTLRDLVEEMEKRYEAMRDAGTRSTDGLGFPKIVVVVDELADLMMAAPKVVEGHIVRLAQKARAAGIHLVLATQRPSVDVVTGLIKANVPSRLAFSTSSLVDSRVVLDEAGAEQLLGMGDGLFKPVGARAATRFQAAFVTDEQIEEAVDKAMARGDVHRMVEKLHPEPKPEDGEGELVIDFINGLINRAEEAALRAGDHVRKLSTPKKFLGGKNNNKLALLADCPIELGIATDVLVEIAADLTMLRDEALAQGGQCHTLGE